MVIGNTCRDRGREGAGSLCAPRAPAHLSPLPVCPGEALIHGTTNLQTQLPLCAYLYLSDFIHATFHCTNQENNEIKEAKLTGGCGGSRRGPGAGAVLEQGV